MHFTSKSVTTKLYTSIFNKAERYNFGHILQLSFEIKGNHPNSLFEQQRDVSCPVKILRYLKRSTYSLQ